MFPRHICRISTDIFQISKPAAMHVLRAKHTLVCQKVQKQAIILSSRSASVNTEIVHRFYSQEAHKELPNVDFEYVKRAIPQNEVLIIDVREPDEIKEHGKIPNSINIPLGTISSTLALSEKEFEQTYNRAKPKENSEIIFYCMIGKRSAKAQQSAINLGFKNAKNYLGSWTDWAVRNQ